MTRKDWLYIPLNVEMVRGLEDIVSTGEIKRYGILDRNELIRIIIGQFIRRFDLTGEIPFDDETRRLLKPFYQSDNNDDDDDDDDDDKIISRRKNKYNCI